MRGATTTEPQDQVTRSGCAHRGGATVFVGAATFRALSGQPVAHRVLSDVPEVPHVTIGQEADLVLVVPTTANLLAKAAHGLADDLLTNTLLTARCPIMMAPADARPMWEHAATQANVATLRGTRGVVARAGERPLTGKDTGKGRLADPAELVDLARLLLVRPDALPCDMAGLRVVVSAGGTREPLDPVRYLGNDRRASRATRSDRGATGCAGHAGCTHTVALPDLPVDVVSRRHRPGAAGTRCTRCHRRRTWGSWLPPWPLPAGVAGRVQDQEDRPGSGSGRSDTQSGHTGRARRLRHRAADRGIRGRGVPLTCLSTPVRN